MFRLVAKPEHGAIQTLSGRARSVVAGRRSAILLPERLPTTHAAAGSGGAVAVRGRAVSNANRIRSGIASGKLAVEGAAVGYVRQWIDAGRIKIANGRTDGERRRG